MQRLGWSEYRCSAFRFSELGQSIWSFPLLGADNRKEVDMFARNVFFHLKPNMLSDYARTSATSSQAAGLY
jgi:hypothetical protein